MLFVVFFFCFFVFFFNDTATTEIYTLSLHDALPIFFVAARAFKNLYFTGFAVNLQSVTRSAVVNTFTSKGS